MLTTISLKIPSDLAFRLKRTSKIRKTTMSAFIRQMLENILSENTKQDDKDPDFFKYLGKFKVDSELKEFNEDLKNIRTNFKLKQIEF